MLCEDLEGRMGLGGREVQEGGIYIAVHVGTHITDSLHCIAQTSMTL